MHNIEWISDASPCVNYNHMDMDVDAAVEFFEEDFAGELGGCDRDNIGGIYVYLRGGDVVAVYDYENFLGWFAGEVDF